MNGRFIKGHVVPKEWKENLSRLHSGIQGEFAPNWKGGFPKCTDCGKVLKSRNALRCKSCYGVSRRGDKHPNYKDGVWCEGEPRYPNGWTKTLKEAIKQRDGYKCTECDAEDMLSVHHKDSNRENLNPDNLVTLCMSCHGRITYKSRLN